MRKHFLFFSLSLVIVSILGIAAINKDGNRKPVITKKLEKSDPQVKDHGIGPVKSVELGPLNKKMTDDGKAIFNNKCTICHDLDQKKIGPPLRNVSKDRAPEFIMNLLLNSAQMQKENPIIKDLLKKYNNMLMPDPALNQAQARSVLEYLRSVSK